MTLSTVLGAQSVVKPGVCTTATRPASPFEGQMIYDTTVDTTLVWNGSAWIGASGKVLQVVAATTSTQATSSSSALADTGLTATITPTSTSSKVLVYVSQNGVGKGNNAYAVIKLLRGATAINTLDETAAYTNSVAENRVGSVSGMYLDTPATTSATTYKTQFSSASGIASVYVQLSNATSSIVLMEISA